MAMDKLQPIIKHHFWIVFLVAVLLPPVAWWMTTGELAAEISDRTSSLDNTFSGIASGQNAPNQDWADGVNQLISIRTQANQLALDRLWQAQTDLMVWPPVVAEYMNACPYRGELDDVRMKQVLPAMYRDGYDRDVRRVWHIPEPIDDGKTRVDANAKQKVVFPYSALPRIPASKWEGLPPTWQEIWNAQEDLWLLGEVLAAVRRTNDSTSSITDSYVKQIMQVQLFGGTKAAAPSSSGSTAGTSGYPGMAPGYPGMAPGMPGGAGRRGGTSALSKPAEFLISEEYEVASSGGITTSSYMNEEGSNSGGGATTASDPNSDENRYVQSEEAYRTRGFKLKVAIDQMQVPTLIRELLNSQYPIEVIRFQQSAMNPEEPGKPTSRRAGYPGSNSLAGMNSGYPGSETESYPTESEGSSLESYSEETFGFDGEGAGTGADALSGKSYTVPAIANVQASLEDRDLVELVVIGEIYIYNPPAVDESAVSSENSGQMADSATTSGAPQVTDTGVDGPAVPVETTTVAPAASVVPGNDAATPATSSALGASDVPETPGTSDATAPDNAEVTGESSSTDSSDAATTVSAPTDEASPPSSTESP
tara:strand:+ start:108580 stop:110361 length:1782 start_codon:yes stop_codon:yes gene_type:complete